MYILTYMYAVYTYYWHAPVKCTVSISIHISLTHDHLHCVIFTTPVNTHGLTYYNIPIVIIIHPWSGRRRENIKMGGLEVRERLTKLTPCLDKE